MKRIFCVFVFFLILFSLSPTAQCYGEPYAYISNSADNTVSIIDTSATTLAASVTVDVGSEPWGVEISPRGDYVYVANKSDGTVSVIQTADNTVINTISVGNQPWGLTASNAGDYVYVTNSTDNTVSVIQTSDNTVINTITVGSTPLGIVVTPEGDYVYVTNMLDNTVSVIETSTYTVTATISVGNAPAGVAITPEGDYVYVTNNTDNTVSVIRTSDNAVTATITVGSVPWGVATASEGEYVYVANSADNTVSVIETSSTTVIATVAVGTEPLGVAAILNGDSVYVTNSVDGTVSVINISDNSVISTIDVGNVPISFGRFIGGLPPAAPSDLTVTSVSQKQINIAWTDNADNEQGFKIERKQGSAATYSLLTLVGPDVTSYNDSAPMYYRTYYYRIKSYNEAADSLPSNEVNATTDEEDTSNCFIATAAYGSSLHRHVETLRFFRDRFLIPSRTGRTFVHFYYEYSPPVARFISQHQTVRAIVRYSLLPLVGISWIAVNYGIVPSSVIAFVVAVFFGLTAFALFRKFRVVSIRR